MGLESESRSAHSAPTTCLRLLMLFAVPVAICINRDNMAKIVHLRNIKRALQLEPSSSLKYVIGGRVSNLRNYKSVNFVDLIDGSTQRHLQVIIKKDILKKPQLGSYLICRGDIISSPGPKQDLEFKVDQIIHLGECDPSKYPLVNDSDKKIPDGWFRKNLHLRPRASHFASLLRVRSELEMSLHMIFKQMDFLKVHTPILTANDSEASSDLFMIQRSRSLEKRSHSRWTQPGDHSEPDTDRGSESSDEGSDCGDAGDCGDPGAGSSQEERRLKAGYFRGKDVFLITSAQLHLECLAASLSRVYCLAPTFRAETTMSQRHLCEFTMLEAEESNVSSLEPLMSRVESIVKFAAQYLGEVSEFRDDFASLLAKYSNERIYQQLTESSFIRMAYDEAIEILQKPKFASSGLDCQYGCDINRKHERALLQHCNNVPIFLTNYPKHLKPFYMKTCDKLPDKAQNFDLIAPFGGEICGGSLREDNLRTLRRNLNLDRYKPKGQLAGEGENHDHPFNWYLQLCEFGPYPHGGFGLGLDRLLQSLVGIKNIRDTVAFPRWPGNCAM